MKNALKILKKNKNKIIINSNNFKITDEKEIRKLGKIFLLQDRDKINIDKKKLKIVTKNKPNKTVLQNLEFAFNVCKFTKSNAIVLVNKKSTIGIGAGQASRIDSCKIAISKARKFQSSKIKNAVAASDAFFSVCRWY